MEPPTGVATEFGSGNGACRSGASRVFIPSGGAGVGRIRGWRTGQPGGQPPRRRQNHCGGSRVVVPNADRDAKTDLAVGSGAARPARERLYLGKDFAGGVEPAATSLDVFGGAVLADGVYIG